MLSGWTSRDGREGGKTGKNQTHKCTYESLCHLQCLLPCQSSHPTETHQHFFSSSVSPYFCALTLTLSVMLTLVSLPLVCKNNTLVCVYTVCIQDNPSVFACMPECVCFSSVRRDLSQLPRANELHLNPAPLIPPLAQFLCPWGHSLLWPGNCGAAAAAAILAHQEQAAEPTRMSP